MRNALFSRGLALIALAGCLGARPPARGGGGIEWVAVPEGILESSGSAEMLGRPPRIRVEAFRLAKTPVTNRQYARCVKAGACSPAHDYGERFSGADQPVVGVTWRQAKAFSEWVGGRLPTAVEWDYASRSAGKYRRRPWGDQSVSCERAILFDRALGGAGCGRLSTWPVCAKPAGNTEQGICDMGGHVNEWVEDQPKGDPGYRFVYGSPWDEPTKELSPFEWEPEQAQYDYLGFRPAR